MLLSVLGANLSGSLITDKGVKTEIFREPVTRVGGKIIRTG